MADNDIVDIEKGFLKPLQTIFRFARLISMHLMNLDSDTDVDGIIKSIIKAIYPGISCFTLANMQNSSFENSTNIGFLPLVRTNKNFSTTERNEMLSRFQNFLSVKLKTDSVRIVPN